jgi:serine protease Do
MKRYIILLFVFILIFPVCIYAQQGATVLRDYVGLINQSYHPGIVAYFEKAKKEYEKQGEKDSAKFIDIILGGAFGSGFLYNDAKGNLYVITNNHVISQAHTISITFERADGTTKKIENLKLIATDVDADLAIMAIPAGDKPFVTQGLSLLTRAVDEGEDAYSAGFPGLGITPIWQFGRGMISNASVKFPKGITDETMMGPYIQHTAQVDSGNSGGPLLVAQRNVPSGYAVAGVNTLSGIRRQAANYAIPVKTLQTFINDALNPKPETFRSALDALLEKFVKGLGDNKAVYPHIAEYLSIACIGENAEYALEELFKRAPVSARRAFIEKSREDPIGAMDIAVAWTIEDSIRTGSSALKAAVKEVTGEGEEYTVTFTINNKDAKSVWIREYGNWRIKSFGSVAKGDKDLLTKRQKEKETSEKLHTNNSFYFELGYANLFDKKTNANAFYLSMDLFLFGFNFYYVSPDLFSICGLFSINYPIPVGNFAFIPYGRFGMAYIRDVDYGRFKSPNNLPGDRFEVIVNDVYSTIISPIVQGGLKVTTSYIPGLYGNIGFQYNIPIPMIGYDEDYKNPFKSSLVLSVGYTF